MKLIAKIKLALSRENARRFAIAMRKQIDFYPLLCAGIIFGMISAWYELAK